MNQAATDEFEGMVPLPDAKQLGGLNKPVKKARDLARLIEDLEDMIKVHKTELNILLQTTIPGMMKAIGLSDFRTDDGARVEVRDFISGSLPKDASARKSALAWLEDHDGGDLIKRNFEIAIERGDDLAAEQVRKALKPLNSVDVAEEVGVHPQTLAAFARERIKNGEEIDLDLLGLYSGSVAKITAPRLVKKAPAAPPTETKKALKKTTAKKAPAKAAPKGRKKAA